MGIGISSLWPSRPRSGDKASPSPSHVPTQMSFRLPAPVSSSSRSPVGPGFDLTGRIHFAGKLCLIGSENPPRILPSPRLQSSIRKQPLPTGRRERAAPCPPFPFFPFLFLLPFPSVVAHRQARGRARLAACKVDMRRHGIIYMSPTDMALRVPANVSSKGSSRFCAQ